MKRMKRKILSYKTTAFGFLMDSESNKDKVAVILTKEDLELIIDVMDDWVAANLFVCNWRVCDLEESLVELKEVAFGDCPCCATEKERAEQHTPKDIDKYLTPKEIEEANQASEKGTNSPRKI